MSGTTPTTSIASTSNNPLLDLSFTSEKTGSVEAETPKQLDETEAAVDNVATTILTQETPVPAKSLCSRFFTVIKEFFIRIFSIFTCAVKKPNEDPNQISAAGKAGDLIQKAEAKFGSNENREDILKYIKKVSEKPEYTTDPKAFVEKWMEKQKTKQLTLNFFKEIFNIETVPVPSSKHEITEERVNNNSFMSSNEEIVSKEIVNEDADVNVGSPPLSPEFQDDGNEEGGPPPPPPGEAFEYKDNSSFTITKSEKNSLIKNEEKPRSSQDKLNDELKERLEKRKEKEKSTGTSSGLPNNNKTSTTSSKPLPIPGKSSPTTTKK
jgi:hypothetical protein